MALALWPFVNIHAPFRTVRAAYLVGGGCLSVGGHLISISNPIDRLQLAVLERSILRTAHILQHLRWGRRVALQLRTA